MKNAANSNRSILNFFKPSQNASNQQQPTQSSPPEIAIPQQNSMSNTQTPQSSESGLVTQTESLPESSALKNGKLVVRSSDSEDSDDSDSSLPDPSTWRKPTMKATSGNRMKTPTKPKRGLRSVKLDDSPIPVRTALRNDMAALLKQAKKDQKEESNREKVLALLNNDLPDPEEEDDEFDSRHVLERVIIDGEDEGKVGRVLQAMKRQEAGNTESRWFFFDTLKEDSGRSEFPQQALGQCRWKPALTNATTFRETVLSGFAEHMVAMGEELPEELLLWMLNEVCFEVRDSVRHAYCRIITSHPPSTISQLMGSKSIQRLFRNVGGTEKATTTSQSIGPVPKTIKEYHIRSWNPLISLVTLLGSVAQGLSKESRNYSICLLARLCMDSIVLEKLALFQAIQDSIESLVISIPQALWTSECNSISRTIFAFTELSTLQLQVLDCIPDKNNPRLHHLRRSLALAHFFSSPQYLSPPLSTTINLPLILAHLSSSPRFLVTPSTDYRELSASISIFSIAIADGRAPSLPPSLNPNLLPKESPEAESQEEEEEEEDQFNQSIDNLISSLEAISAGIRDASAAHPSRSDAKNAIKVVLLRLGTARTKVKPKVSIWGEDDSRENSMEDDVGMMARFVGMVKEEKGVQEGESS